MALWGPYCKEVDAPGPKSKGHRILARQARPFHRYQQPSGAPQLTMEGGVSLEKHKQEKGASQSTLPFQS